MLDGGLSVHYSSWYWRLLPEGSPSCPSFRARRFRGRWHPMDTCATHTLPMRIRLEGEAPLDAPGMPLPLSALRRGPLTPVKTTLNASPHHSLPPPGMCFGSLRCCTSSLTRVAECHTFKYPCTGVPPRYCSHPSHLEMPYIAVGTKLPPYPSRPIRRRATR